MPGKLLILWIPKRNWNEKLTENIQIQHLRADQCEKNISFHTHLEAGTFWVMYTLRTIYSGKFIALFVVRQELQPWSESVMHQPIPLVPFHQELWGTWSRFRRLGTGEGGGGLLIFCYYTRRPGICLDPGQPCGRELTLAWFQSRTWNRFEFMVMSTSDHHCTSASGMQKECEIFMNMVCNTSLVYYDSKWILNAEIKMFIKNWNVFKCSETKWQFLSENIENK